MIGVFSKLPDDRLSCALAPISEFCSNCEWAVDLYSGPFRHFHFIDDDDTRNLLHLFHDWPDAPFVWFRKGVLPRYADDLILDEWSYYLAYDPAMISGLELRRRAGDGIHPRPELFSLIREFNLLYIIRVDEGWWEAYCTIPAVHEALLSGWAGVEVSSDRWETNTINPYPFPLDRKA